VLDQVQIGGGMQDSAGLFGEASLFPASRLD
jgi:hypothetical protein